MNPNNNSSHKNNNLFHSQNIYDNNNNIFIDDTNYQMINLNGINKSSVISNLIGYSGKDNIKEIINNINNEIAINLINKEKKFAQSSKTVFTLKNGIKGMKLKRDYYFNSSNKITINAKVNEINKPNK